MAMPETILLVPCPDLETYAAAARNTLSHLSDGLVIPILGDAKAAADLIANFLELDLEICHEPLPQNGAGDKLLQDLWPADGTAGVMAVIEPSPETLPAVFYGLVTGRRIVAVDDCIGCVTMNGPASTMLAGQADAFDKAALARLLDWQLSAPEAPQSLGLLTGRDAVHLALIVARLLITRACHAAGYYLPPDQLEGAAEEFLLIGAHGNEIQLDYGAGSILCGRPDEAQSVTDKRVSASSLKANTILLMSCDGFTPTQGIAPVELSILFGLLDGRAACVLAPFKHVQANEPLLILINAMARTGYPIGEIAQVLNARANWGVLPDPAFLVLGDPDQRVVPQDGPGAKTAETVVTSRGTVVRVNPSDGAQAITVQLARPSGRNAPTAVLPLSPAARAANMFFTLGVMADDNIEVTVFRDSPFDPGLMEVAVMPAAIAQQDMIHIGKKALKRSGLLTHIFGKDPDMEASVQVTTETLHMAAAFPRPIEQLSTQKLMLALEAMIDNRLGGLRRAAAALIANRLGDTRIWISQRHADLFADIRRAGPNADGPCSHCGTMAFVWAYTDPVNGHDPRHVTICHRCGIVADGPSETELALRMTTLKELREKDVTLKVSIINRGSRAATVSLILQLNEWRTLCVEGSDWQAELTIPPSETLRHAVNLSLPSDFPDDILSIQLFVLDQDLNLHFRSQKIWVSLASFHSTTCGRADASSRSN